MVGSKQGAVKRSVLCGVGDQQWWGVKGNTFEIVCATPVKQIHDDWWQPSILGRQQQPKDHKSESFGTVRCSRCDRKGKEERKRNLPVVRDEWLLTGISREDKYWCLEVQLWSLIRKLIINPKAWSPMLPWISLCKMWKTPNIVPIMNRWKKRKEKWKRRNYETKGRKEG